MAEQELDSLLIKIDSELGDLKGIESAITALQRLNTFTSNAAGNIKQLKDLGSAMKSFNNIKGLNETVKGVNGMITAFERLTKVTQNASQAISQLGAMGHTLNTAFGGIGKNLEGINKVSQGLNTLVTVLERMTKMQGDVNGAVTRLGDLGRELQAFNNVNLSHAITNVVEPIERMAKAFRALDKIEWRRTRNSYQQFRDALDHDKRNLDLGDMFDISRPVEQMVKSLKTAERHLESYEKKARDSADKVRSLEGRYQHDTLLDRKDYRIAVNNSEMAQAYAEAYRQGIPQLRQAIERSNMRALTDAWRNTQRAIVRENRTFNLGDLVNTDLPLNQLRENLRRMQNELSRAQSEMSRSMANIQRLRAVENNENNLRANSGYRSSVYTFSTARHHVEAYTRAIQQLQNVISSAQILPQTDAQAYRMLTQAEGELRRYSEVLDKLLAQDDQSASGQRTIESFVRGVDMIESNIAQINNMLENDLSESTEGLMEHMRRVADETERVARATAEANQNMRNTIGEGFGQFGSMLSGSGNRVLGSIGKLTSMFGNAAKSGTAKLNTAQLESLAGLAGKLGTVATAISQIGAVVGVVAAAFKTWWDVTEKMISALNKFVQSCVQFAKDMLSKVVGAFNAVAGAVSKVVSAVRSGAQMIVSALRKIGEVGEKITSVFASVGRGIAVFGKGAKAIASLVTPKTVKNLVSANKSIKDIIKNSKLLSTAIQSVAKWFTMLTRMLMRKIVQQFITGMKQAFDDLVLFEKEANDGMMNLNTNVSKIFSALRRAANQWIAAFEPLINAVTPVVLNFLNNVQAFGENVAKFMAILTGQPYYIRAKQFYEDYGEQVDKTAKKVKNLTNGLDELNILNDSSDDDSGITPEDMFEKVPVDGELVIPTLEDILEKFKDWLRNIDWDWLKEKAREIVSKIFDIINTILRDKELWQLLGKTVGEIINFLFTILNEAVHDLDWAALGQAITEFLKNALETIDWSLIRDTVVTLAKGIATTFNEIFADRQLWIDIGSTIAHVINDVIVAYLDNFAWTFNFKNFADAIATAIKTALEGIDWAQIRHAIDGWTKGIVDVINAWAHDRQLWIDIGNTIKHIINDIFINAFTDLSEIDFSALTERIKEAINKALEIDWSEFNRGVQNWAKNIADIINGFFADATFLTNITTAIANLANAILRGFDTLIEKIKAYDIGNKITAAILEGFKKIDWDVAFTLPADLINKLTEFVRGIIDALPEGGEIANWLTTHLIAGITAVNWEEIARNLFDLATKIRDFIEGVLKNQDFWTLLGQTTGNIITIGIDFLFNLVNVKGEDLGTAIYNYINGLIDHFDIGKVLSKTVDVFINIVAAIDVALTGVHWDELADQITKGIVDAVNKLYTNRGLIQKTIEDAFGVFGSTVRKVLLGMLNNDSFYKIGQTIGSVIMGIINGVWEFFDLNTDLILQGISELADSLASYLREHHDEIVAKLNGIIHSIVDIIDTFFDEKGGFMAEILRIIEELDLDTLIGSIVRTALIKLKAKLKLKAAIWKAVVDSGILDEIWDAIVGIAKDIGKWILNKILTWTFDFSPMTAWLSVLRRLLFGENGEVKIDLGKLFDGIKFVLTGLLKNPLTNVIDDIKRLFGGGNLLGDFFNNLFGKKDKKIDVPITVTPKVDDSKIEPITIEDTQYGTIKANYITVSTLKVTTLNVKEIYADTLYVGDIFADVLHIKKIDMDSTEGTYRLPENYGENNIGVNSGVLTRDEGFDKITTKLIEAEKIVTDLIEAVLITAEKIQSELLEVKKITSDLLKVSTIDGKTLNVPKINAESLKLAIINGTTLNIDDIKAKNLHVDGGSTPTRGTDVSGTETGGTERYKGDRVTGENPYLNPRIFDTSIKRWSDRLSNIKSAREWLEEDGYTSGGTGKGTIGTNEGGGIGKGGTDRNEGDYRTKTTGQELLDLFSGFDPNKLFEDFDPNKLFSGIDWDKLIGEPVKDAFDRNSKYDVTKGSDTKSDKGTKGGKKVDTGRYKSDGEEEELDDIFPDDFVSNEDIKTINTRLDSIYKDVKAFLDKVKKLFKDFKFSDLFLPKSEVNATKSRLDDIMKSVKGILDGIEDEIDELIDRVKDKLKELGDEAFDGLKDKAEQALSEVSAVVDKYVGEIKAKFEEINAASKTLFSGMADEASKELTSVLNYTRYYLSQIEAEFEEFTSSAKGGWIDITVAFQDALGDLPLIAEATMADVYDIIDIWLERIYELLESFFTPDLFAGLTTGLKKALDEAYKQVEEWVKKVKKLIEDAFSDLSGYLDGEWKIVNINQQSDRHLDLNTIAKSQNTKAVEALTQAINNLMSAIQGGLSGIECNCNCGGDCGSCAIGGGGNTQDPTHLDLNTKAKSENTKAVEKLNNSINNLMNAIQGGLGNITCNCTCNCNCDCGGCACGKGGGGTPDKPTGGTGGGNDKPDTPTGSTGGGTPTTPTGGTGGDIGFPYKPTGDNDGGGTPTSPTGGTGGGGGTPTTPTGDTGGGNDKPDTPTGGTGGNDKPDTPTGGNDGGDSTKDKSGDLWLRRNGTRYPLYALIGGKWVRLNDNLPDALKDLIASGMFPISDGQNILNDGLKNNIVDWLKRKGWGADSKDSGTGGSDDGWLKWTKPDGSTSYLTATIGGGTYDINESLPDAIKKKIAEGNADIRDESGSPIPKDVKDKLMNYLKNIGWGGEGGSGSGTAGSNNGSGTGGGSGSSSGGDIFGGGSGGSPSNGGGSADSDTYDIDDGGSSGGGTSDTPLGGGSSDTPPSGISDGDVGGNDITGDWGDISGTDFEDILGVGESDLQDLIDAYEKEKEKQNKKNRPHFEFQNGILGYVDENGNFHPVYANFNGINFPITDSLDDSVKKWLMNYLNAPTYEKGLNFGFDGSPLGDLIGGNVADLQGALAKHWKDPYKLDAIADAVSATNDTMTAGSGGIVVNSGGTSGNAYNGDLGGIPKTSSDTPAKTESASLAKVKQALDDLKEAYFTHVNNGTTNITNGHWKYRESTFKDAYTKDVQEAIANANSPVNYAYIGGEALRGADAQAAYDYWYNGRFKSYGYQMGGIPNAGEIFVARENGTPEYVGSFGSKTAVANNDQIVTAVANGVSMAQDKVVSAIENQTSAIETAIDRKDMDVQIGDRQIAEANRRGEKSLGQNFLN